MIILWIFLIIIAVFVLIAYRKSTKPKTPRTFIRELRNDKVKLVYQDNGNGRVFASESYKIRAKPDFIYTLPTGDTVLVEYKSRHRGIYESDVKQLIATAIAVNGHYPNIKHGYIYNRLGEVKHVNLNFPLSMLAQKIQVEVASLRSIATGSIPTFSPVPVKCRYCAFVWQCDKKIS